MYAFFFRVVQTATAIVQLATVFRLTFMLMVRLNRVHRVKHRN